MKAHVSSPRILILAMLLVANVFPAWSMRVNCRMAANGSQVYEDANARLFLQLDAEGNALLLVENKTDVPISVDRAHSFAYICGESFPLFKPGVHTESYTQTSGVVDYDRISRSDEVYMRSHTDSYTEYDCPMQGVAPHGTAVVYVFPMLSECFDSRRLDVGRRGGVLHFSRRGGFIDESSGDKRRFHKGDVCRYTETSTPLALSAFVQYAFSDSSETWESLRVRDYVEEVCIGGKQSARPDTFSFRSGGGNGMMSFEIGVSAALAAVLACSVGAFVAF